MSEPCDPRSSATPFGEDLVAVYLRKRSDLVRFFVRRTGSEAAAEDIVQDIYLRLASASDLSRVHNPEAFLYRLGTNLMLDRVKGLRRRAIREQSWARLWAGDSSESISDQPSSEDVVVARERMAVLIRALDALPTATAQAFRLHKFEGLSHVEIAERLGVSRSTIEKYIMAALRHLLASDVR